MAEKKKKKPKATKSAKTAKTVKTVKTAKPKKARAAPAKKPAAKKAAPAPKSRRRAAKPKAAPRRAIRSKPAPINVADLLDHPLVADLISVGAMAAIAAIADHNVKTRTGEAQSGSSRAVKAAGKAAAAAIGKRLMTEVDAIKKASKKAETKRGSK